LINEASISLIKLFEGCSLTAYHGSADRDDLYTIGYGSTRGLDGNPVRSNHRDITQLEADQLLTRDLKRFEIHVRRLVAPIPLNPNQFGAMVSICFNIGPGRFRAATFRQKLIRYDYLGCAENLWQYRRSNGIIRRGLVRRRASEKRLFLNENYHEN
jgi:lysozyme